mmetsp:Transcript_179/g.598  ORF Transcript_179/g.598 Transcript_179/m.598 type:complete len:424 (-) Transcript_179:13-1284(-)
MAGKVWRRFKDEDGAKTDTDATEAGKDSESGQRAKLKRPFKKLVSKFHHQPPQDVQAKPSRVAASSPPPRQSPHHSPRQVTPIWPLGADVEVYSMTEQRWMPGKVIKCDVEEGKVSVEVRTKDGSVRQQELPSGHPHIRQRASPQHRAPGPESPVTSPVHQVHVRFADRPPSIHEVTPYAKQYSVRPKFFDFDADGNKVINEQAVDFASRQGQPITPEELQRLRQPPTSDWMSESTLTAAQLYSARNGQFIRGQSVSPRATQSFASNSSPTQSFSTVTPSPTQSFSASNMQSSSNAPATQSFVAPPRQTTQQPCSAPRAPTLVEPNRTQPAAKATAAATVQAPRKVVGRAPAGQPPSASASAGAVPGRPTAATRQTSPPPNPTSRSAGGGIPPNNRFHPPPPSFAGGRNPASVSAPSNLPRRI